MRKQAHKPKRKGDRKRKAARELRKRTTKSRRQPRRRTPTFPTPMSAGFTALAIAAAMTPKED